MVNSRRISDIPWDLRSDPVPILVLLEHLAKFGWARAASKADKVARHTLGTPRVLWLSGKKAQDKAYVQCLVFLEGILATGVPSVDAGKPAAYYHGILEASLAPAGQPAAPGASGAHEATDSSEEEPVLQYFGEARRRATRGWARPPRRDELRFWPCSCDILRQRHEM